MPVSIVVKVGKAAKRTLKKFIPEQPASLSYTRRIERIKTDKHLCAMTFDDGPMDLPAAPDRFGGRALTDVLLDILGQYGAKGTFDVVGDTSENYPDQAGKLGSPAWGGIKYDHYPDLDCDSRGGAAHCDRLIRRVLEEGHQLTNHGYRHIIFGRKNIVYGARVSLDDKNLAVNDLTRLDTLLREQYQYQLTMGRPPHYVDKIKGGFSSYDVYDTMGYQYLAASFDGGGWLPSTLSDPDAALEAEINAMVEPMRKALEANPDFFCGQIIFQKDGYNMAKRTPVAFALSRQLELLKEYGYQVVTVERLMEESPFTDVGRDDPLFEKLYQLQQERAIVYSNNTLCLDKPITYGELAMLLAPREEAINRRQARIARTGKGADHCCGALEYCIEQGILSPETQSTAPVSALPEPLFDPTSDYTRRGVYTAYRISGPSAPRPHPAG